MKAEQPVDLSTRIGCRQCHFFAEHANGAGDCHRFPPVFCGTEAQNERHRWKHPLVNHTNWCGEYRVRALASA